MKNVIMIAGVLVVVGVGIYLLTSTNNTPTSTAPLSTPPLPTETSTVAPAAPTTTAPSQTPPHTTSASSVVVDIKNYLFTPSNLAIKVGTNVTWTNNDVAPHTVTSDIDGLLASQVLSPGQSFSFTFKDPGTTKYHCSIHRAMTGTVTVTK